MKNPAMKEAERAFIHTVMFTEGIVPMENPAMDVRRALKDVSPEDARKMKRKFRKMWRKQVKALASKEKTGLPTHLKSVTAMISKKGTAPSRRQKLRRKEVVTAHLMKTRVEPMIKQFKDLTPAKKEGKE